MPGSSLIFLASISWSSALKRSRNSELSTKMVSFTPQNIIKVLRVLKMPLLVKKLFVFLNLGTAYVIVTSFYLFKKIAVDICHINAGNIWLLWLSTVL